MSVSINTTFLNEQALPSSVRGAYARRGQNVCIMFQDKISYHRVTNTRALITRIDASVADLSYSGWKFLGETGKALYTPEDEYYDCLLATTYKTKLQFRYRDNPMFGTREKPNDGFVDFTMGSQFDAFCWLPVVPAPSTCRYPGGTFFIPPPAGRFYSHGEWAPEINFYNQNDGTEVGIVTPRVLSAIFFGVANKIMRISQEQAEQEGFIPIEIGGFKEGK